MQPMNTATSQSPKVFIMDSHPIVRTGLAQVLQEHLSLELCGESDNFLEASKALRELQPELVITESLLNGYNCFELLRFVSESCPNSSVLVFSNCDEEIYAERALQAGAKGYLMKDASHDEILVAVERVLRGGVYLSEKMTSKMLFLATSGRRELQKSPVDRLSNRELEVFQLLGEGFSTRQIADHLHVSVKTVESHRARIKTKLNLDDANTLLRFAILWSSQRIGNVVDWLQEQSSRHSNLVAAS
ncbi:MAG: response regulator transcription factor [Deltaproteobacteria bacterium]|nr:MAG: response regulator transcription factor [Deltaproteobacteria bacterium]